MHETEDYISLNISEVHMTSIIRVMSNDTGSTCASLHNAISHKAVIFSLSVLFKNIIADHIENHMKHIHVLWTN
jgi:hypothetical protein